MLDTEGFTDTELGIFLGGLQLKLGRSIFQCLIQNCSLYLITSKGTRCHWDGKVLWWNQ